jgi:signal transduction histidine kinase
MSGWTAPARPRAAASAVFALLAVLCLSPAVARADLTASHDFNAVRLPRVTDQQAPYPGWTVQLDGRVWHDVSFTAQGPDSSVCLQLRASMVDPGMTDAAVRLRFDLSPPEEGVARHVLGHDAVLQWDWWIRDNKFSEAVGARLVYVVDGVRRTREFWNTPFYTPSDGFAPVLQWDCRRIDLADIIAPCPDDSTASCTELEAIEFELRGPVSQELRLDNIYLGPRAGVRDCDEARTPGFLIMKSQSYSAAFGDLDRDGRPDALLPGFVGRPAQVWAGRDEQFLDRAADLGLDRYLGDVCLLLDVDNDGDPDVVAARVEEDGLLVFENRGHGRFASAPRVFPTVNRSVSVGGLAAGDIDGDGCVDVYVARYGDADELMLGDGRGGFAAAGPDIAAVLADTDASNGVAIADLDRDGDQDLLVSGVGLMRNDGRGGLTVEPLPLTAERLHVIEGVTVADLDADGLPDLYLGMDQDSCRRPYSGRNLLYWNDGAHGWRRDRRSNTEVADAGHCEGVVAADFDNDGHLDLFVGNRAGPSLCLLGAGGGGFRPERGEVFGPVEISDLAGVCAVDRDGDRDLDLFVVRKHNDPLYLENVTGRRTAVTVELLGARPNRDAIGAMVELTGPGGVRLLRERRGGGGYQLSGPPGLHFGVPDEGPFRVEARFPSGLRVVREGVRAGDHVVMVETTSPVAATWLRWTRRTLPAWSAAVARWPMPAQHLVLAALAALLAMVIAAVPGAGRRCPAGRGPAIVMAVLLSLAVALAVRHHVAWHRADSWGALVSLPLGVAAGLGVRSLVIRLRQQRAPVDVWDRLNDEFISYTHTGWCKNLETLIRQGGMLAGDLSADDRAQLQERWRDAHAHYRSAVRPKLEGIAELGALLDETRAMSRDLATGLRRLNHAQPSQPETVAAAARVLRQTADRLAAVVEAELSCRLADAARTAWRAFLPELEAAGAAGSLDIDGVDQVRVRVREHELVMVLQDLLRNALQAAADGSGAAVTLTAAADLRRATLHILDTGPGLQGRDPEQLLQAGFTTKAGGSGYGLFHAAKVLGRHRGTVNLADRPDGGMDVTITLLRPLHVRGDTLGADA